MKKILALAAGLLLTPLSYAAIQTWEVVPQKSTLSFTATQNNAPVSGKFQQFTGKISFDPANLSASAVNMTVDTSSVWMSYRELADALKSSDWFDTQKFPQAHFKSTSITKISDNVYRVTGDLTIRDKTQSVPVSFILEEQSNVLRGKGSAIIQRTAFGLGQGDWAKTDELKDEVQINYVVEGIHP